MKKKKRILLLVTILILSLAVPCEAFAGTAKPYMTSSTGDMEKTGGSYIYVRDNGDDSRSIVQAKTKNGRENVLLTEYFDRELNEFEYEDLEGGTWSDSNVEVGGLIHKKIITNGKNVFYAMRSHSNPENAVIYKFNIATGKKEKVKIVKRFVTLSAYYDGNLYYCVQKKEDPSQTYAYSVYQIWKYNLKTKKSKWIYTGIDDNTTTSYGRYMSVGGFANGAGIRQNMRYWLFDLKTGTKKSLQCMDAQCAKDGVYYTSYSGDYMAAKSPYKFSLKKSSYNLKNTKTIRTWITSPIGKPGERYYISQLGRTFYQYEDVQKDLVKTVYYKR